MRSLWAPWRMRYIEEARAEKGGCLFCDKAAGTDDEADLVLERGPRTLVLMNLYPYNGGHLMVAPVAHRGDLGSLATEEALEIHEMAVRWMEVVRGVMQPDGFNLGWNLGRVAGAGVLDHVHLHVVPRWNGDTNFMPVVAETKVVNEAIETTRRKLLQAAATSA